jgi:insulin receptor
MYFLPCTYLGICSEVEDGAPMIILELMEFGDLKNFLIQHGPSAGHSTSLTTDHFYKFAADISSALSFLASKQYVHRDIAARNCLVGHGLCVKLADFGLARAVHEKDYYRVKKGSMLPLRWMAPESVKYGIFTLESDIWSCGVLLWEIASYAQHPYGNMSANELITAFEHESAFLPKPPDCPEKLYDVIQLCQSYPAELRPKMSELHLLFQSLLSS